MLHLKLSNIYKIKAMYSINNKELYCNSINYFEGEYKRIHLIIELMSKENETK